MKTKKATISKKFNSVEEIISDMEKSWKEKPWYVRAFLTFKWKVLDSIWDMISPIKNSRRIRFLFQRITRGFSDDVLWSMDYEIAKWILPRLKRFKDIKSGIPGSGLPSQISFEEEQKLTQEERDKLFEKLEGEWDSILCEMIEAFQLVVADEWNGKKDMIEKEKKIKKGLKQFSLYFRGLWC